MNTAETILSAIDPSKNLDLEVLLGALEDGAVLASLGFTEADQLAIEEAHAKINEMIAYWSIRN